MWARKQQNIVAIASNNDRERSRKILESYILAARCSISEATDAPKCPDHILPLISNKRLCGLIEDELSRIAATKNLQSYNIEA